MLCKGQSVECWTVKNQYKNKVSMSKMRMVHWMCGKTRQDKIRYDNFRERELG